MPRKGENIYKRKDGRWEGRYIKAYDSNGKAVYGYLYAHSYRDVKEKMIHIKSQIGEKKQNNEVPQNIIFKNIAQEWLCTMEPHIKESTQVRYRNLLKWYILPELGEQFIQDLSQDRIESFCNHLLTKGGIRKRGLAPKTVLDCLALIREILQYCEIKGITVPCRAKVTIIKQHPKAIRVFSRSEQSKLCEYLRKHLNEQNVGILICLFTGMRIGEICALKWKDISLSEQTVYVHLTMQRIQDQNGNKKKTKILISEPKSRCSVRMIPLQKELVELLNKYKSSDDCYVLSGRADKFVEPRTMQNHFGRVVKECAICDANYHSLRHTFATRCVEMGVDIKSLSEILGHANVNITMNRYVHPSMELKRTSMMRLSELIAVK